MAAPVCDLCGEPVDPRVRSNFVRITGYDRPRSAGGTNHVALRRTADPPGFAHDRCVFLAQHKIDPRQGAML